jgi:hypothetical protein
MLQRFLTIGPIPELRPDPLSIDRGIPEIELMIPIDVYHELQELLKFIRYGRLSSLSTSKHWKKFMRLIYPCILAEKDRQWFVKNVM